MSLRAGIVFVLIVSGAHLSVAQTSPTPDIIDPSHADTRILTQSRGLISVRLEPSKPISLYITGTEAAQIDLSELTLVVRNFSTEGSQILYPRQEGDHFVIEEPLDLEKSTDLEVTAKTPKKTETFHFKVSTEPR